MSNRLTWLAVVAAGALLMACAPEDDSNVDEADQADSVEQDVKGNCREGYARDPVRKRCRKETTAPRAGKCPVGYIWSDYTHTSCLLDAPSSRVPLSDSCPDGYIWSDYTHTSCIADEGSPTPSGGDCPDGYVWSDYTHTSCVEYEGSSTPSGGDCPDGYVWSDYTHTSCIPG